MADIDEYRKGSGYLMEIIRSTYPNMSENGREVLMTSVMTNDAVIRKALTAMRSVDLKKERKVPTVIVDSTISAKDKEYLRETYEGHVEIAARISNTFSSHAIPQAMRRATFLCLLSHMAGLENERIVTAGEDAEWVKAQMKTWNVVANFAPILGARDDATRNLRVRGFLRTKNKDYEYKFQHVIKRMEEANVQAKVLVTRDVYDASIEVRALAMDRIGAHYHYYTIMVPDDYFERKKSRVDLIVPKELYGSGIRYWFDSNTNPKKVTFDMGDMTMVYVHDCNIYESLIHATYTVTPNNTKYSCARVAKHSIYSVFKMTRVTTYVMAPKYHVEKTQPITTVKVEIFRYIGGDRSTINSYRRGHYVEMIASDFYRLATAIITDTRKGDPKLFQSAARIFNGITRSTYIVSVQDRKRYALGIDDIPMLLTSIICYAYRLKAITSDQVQDKTNLIMMKRQLESGGFFSMFNITNAAHRLITSIKISLASVRIMLKNSLFVNKLLDIVSLETLNTYFGWNEITLFTPLIETQSTRVRHQFDHHIMRYFRAIGDTGSFFRDMPDDVQQDIREQGEMYETIDEYQEEVVEAQFSKTLSELPVSEISKTVIQSEDSFDQKDYDSRALKEYIELCEYEVGGKIKAAGLNRDLLNGVKTDHLRHLVEETWSEASNDQQNLVVFEVRNKTIENVFPSWLGNEYTSMYTFPIDEVNFSFNHLTNTNQLIKKGEKTKCKNGLHFTFDGINIFPEPRILLSYAQMRDDKKSTYSTSTQLKEAAAGHGKTFDLVNNLYQPGTIVLCASSTNRNEIYRDLLEKYPKIDKRCVRTIDSYLMRNDIGASRLIVDEFFMIPYGKICLARHMAQIPGKRIDEIMIGDRPQIPFLNRYGLDLIYQVFNDKIMRIFDSVSFGQDSKRVSLHQAFHMQQFYPDKIYSTSDVEHNMAYKRIVSVEDVPLFNNVLYLTYTQKNKFEVLKHLKKNGIKAQTRTIEEEYGETKLRTVHESQGMTSKAVILVRLDTSNQTNLWDSSSHALVAISRATHALLFCSIKLVKEDLLHRIFLDRISIDQLNKMRYLEDDRVSLHTNSDCKCGGSNHPLTKLVKEFRAYNDDNRVDKHTSRN